MPFSRASRLAKRIKVPIPAPNACIHANTTQKERQILHPLEREWLLSIHIDFAIAGRTDADKTDNDGHQPPTTTSTTSQDASAQADDGRQPQPRVQWEQMNWDTIAFGFNTRFEGQRLPGFEAIRGKKEAEWLRERAGVMEEVVALKGEGGGIGKGIKGGGGD